MADVVRYVTWEEEYPVPNVHAAPNLHENPDHQRTLLPAELAARYDAAGIEWYAVCALVRKHWEQQHPGRDPG